MTDTGDAVGVIPVSRKPEASTIARDWASLRSIPSGSAIIAMSKSFEGDGSLPAGTTVSMTSRRPSVGMTRRMLPRIVTQSSSDQSWMMWRMVQASAPDGTASKKLPLSSVQQSAQPASRTGAVVRSMTWAWSKRMPRISGYRWSVAAITAPIPQPMSASTDG